MLEFALNECDIAMLELLVRALRTAYGDGVAIIAFEIMSKLVEDRIVVG